LASVTPKPATDEELCYNVFVRQARMKKSKFFCPPEHLVAASNEIEIIGVGDVTIEDAYHRVISGSFGIYA